LTWKTALVENLIMSRDVWQSGGAFPKAKLKSSLNFIDGIIYIVNNNREIFV